MQRLWRLTTDQAARPAIDSLTHASLGYCGAMHIHEQKNQLVRIIAAKVRRIEMEQRSINLPRKPRALFQGI
jgi:hypothetical protein